MVKNNKPEELVRLHISLHPGVAELLTEIQEKLLFRNPSLAIEAAIKRMYGKELDRDND